MNKDKIDSVLFATTVIAWYYLAGFINLMMFNNSIQ